MTQTTLRTWPLSLLNSFHTSLSSVTVLFFSQKALPSWGGYPALTWSSRPVRSYSHVILSCYPISYSTIFNLSTNTCYLQSSNLSTNTLTTIFYLSTNTLTTIFYLSTNTLTTIFYLSTNTLTTIFYLDQLMPE